MSATVKLRGGPYDGEEVPKPRSRRLQTEGPETPDGFVDIYSRVKGESEFYDYEGPERILVRIPMPDSESKSGNGENHE